MSAAASLPAPEPLNPPTRSQAPSFDGRLLDVDEAMAVEIRGTVRAAVLVTLADRDGEPTTVFTRRRADLRRHAGEISFPGGREDPADENLLATAMREAEEEIGLSPAAVRVIGALAPTPTIATNYAIYPFLGVIPDGLTWTPSPAEVAELIELPLRAVRAGYARRRLVRRGVPMRTDTYVVGDHLIWGATARVLGDLFDRIVL